MDILAARKKAAEKARMRPEPEPAPAAEPGPVEAERAAVPPEPAAAPSPAPAPQPAAQTEQPPAPAHAAPAAPGSPGREEAAEAGEGVRETTQELELLSFQLGAEEYAVMVDDVREVLKLRDLTDVPNTPEYILGVTSLRGTMLTVIDLGLRLGLAPGVRDERARIIVASTDEEDVGLLVDRVTGVLKIMAEAIKPPPENVEQGAEFLRGIVRKEDRLVILLDLAKAVGT
jgi:purine-binding chemotaxis protein CheW